MKPIAPVYFVLRQLMAIKIQIETVTLGFTFIAEKIGVASGFAVTLATFAYDIFFQAACERHELLRRRNKIFHPDNQKFRAFRLYESVATKWVAMP